LNNVIIAEINMPEFEFTVTAPATISARVKISANTIEAAHEIAIRDSFVNDPVNPIRFTLDDENIIRDAYIPDSSDYEITAGTENDFREVYEGNLDDVVPRM
jgi:hypothetical protein